MEIPIKSRIPPVIKYRDDPTATFTNAARANRATNTTTENHKPGMSFICQNPSRVERAEKVMRRR